MQGLRCGFPKAAPVILQYRIRGKYVLGSLVPRSCCNATATKKLRSFWALLVGSSEAKQIKNPAKHREICRNFIMGFAEKASDHQDEEMVDFKFETRSNGGVYILLKFDYNIISTEINSMN